VFQSFLLKHHVYENFIVYVFVEVTRYFAINANGVMKKIEKPPVQCAGSRLKDIPEWFESLRLNFLVSTE
jgi:hypothetical protein